VTDLSQARVVATGGGGFLGSFVVEKLKARGAPHVAVPSYPGVDLRDLAQATRYLESERPDLVIHMAATVGGIHFNQAHPGQAFYDNAAMGIHILEACRRLKVPKVVLIGTVCSYPKEAPIPFREEDLWNGYPEETNGPYGVSKKMVQAMGLAYRQEYGMDVVGLIPTNMYGPGDNFRPESSHVIPAMLTRFTDAVETGKPEVVLWGDGTPTREFLYVEDAAEGILMACERYDGEELVNLGTSAEISIRDLASAVAAETGFRGRLVFDATKPNGQPRRKIDVSRARRLFGFSAPTPFAEGLRRTHEWFRREVWPRLRKEGAP
jgi:GDP-L-fucose synthase